MVGCVQALGCPWGDVVPPEEMFLRATRGGAPRGVAEGLRRRVRQVLREWDEQMAGRRWSFGEVSDYMELHALLGVPLCGGDE